MKEILENAIGGQHIGAHGPFWRNLSRDQFVAKVIYGQQLLVVGDGDASNIIKALSGENPFGSDTGTVDATFRRMPAGRPPVPQNDIDFIRQWINEGCPEDSI